MKKTLMATLALCVVTVAVAASAAAADRTITVKMTGKQETPKGDPNGKGTAKIRLSPSKGKVCFRISWSGIGKPVAAHIHLGARGKAGAVVVPLFATPPKHKGCVKAKKSLVRAIAKRPKSYYVNVHTQAFPAGALRAQL
jgi:hypothetical protein